MTRPDTPRSSSAGSEAAAGARTIMRVVVYGLWHLGCVTAACLADAGNQVVGLDLDQPLIDGLNAGKAPIEEPGLTELIATGRKTGRLSFTADAREALHGAGVLW